MSTGAIALLPGTQSAFGGFIVLLLLAGIASSFVALSVNGIAARWEGSSVWLNLLHLGFGVGAVSAARRPTPFRPLPALARVSVCPRGPAMRGSVSV
jgi:hypothetical protein